MNFLLMQFVSAGGALFFVCSVMMAITAHDGDTALLILFLDIQLPALYCTQWCHVLWHTAALYLYDIPTVKKQISKVQEVQRTRKSDCMEHFHENGIPHQQGGKTLCSVLSDSNRGSHIL